jgi:hypothetical protein
LGVRKVLRHGSILLLLLLVGIQLIRPERTNPVVDPSRRLTAIHTVPPEVASLLDRGCRDCHSNETRWPWYSNVAPVSWFVIDHVNHGRSHFNYSDWAKYDANQTRELLTNACSLAREREMPLTSYLLMHRGARLSDADIETLCKWTASVLQDPGGGKSGSR